MRPHLMTLAIVLLSISPLARAEADLTALSLSALSEDKAQAKEAVATLRGQGPAGLEALMGTFQTAIDRHRADPLKAEPMWGRLSAALDAVAAQQDAWSAGLYWYTDLEAAKRAAAESGRPILSLRLLGTLDSEFSCANSRFFRTVLYPNADVRQYLRLNFVLHWKSHRPVPKLTIDFGDGRTIERTITGNSVHYVLDKNGRVIDVIPGLYGPAAFLRAAAAARDVALTTPGDRALAAYHADRLARLRAAWAADLQAVGVPVAGAASYAVLQQPQIVAGPPVGAPLAAAAARIATSKSGIELRPILAMMPERANLAAATAGDDAVWAKIAVRHAADARLDAGSRAVMMSKAGQAVEANNLTAGKKKVEDPVLRLVRNFERSVAEDSVRNEYLFHGQVHEWFVNGQAPAALDDLNEKVYAQLFLMPKSDPWLGLVPADTYTGLPADAAR